MTLRQSGGRKAGGSTDGVAEAATRLRPSRGFGLIEPRGPLSLGSPPSGTQGTPALQRRASAAGGLPAGLRTSMEQLSGVPLHDVRVHYNSPHPARVGALAYTQGPGIHLAHGQEKHLAHEAWHVVQQRQRRVRPTLKVAGRSVNDSEDLEQEADAMGARALAGVGVATPVPAIGSPDLLSSGTESSTLQRQGSDSEADDEMDSEDSDSDSGSKSDDESMSDSDSDSGSSSHSDSESGSDSAVESDSEDSGEEDSDEEPPRKKSKREENSDDSDSEFEDPDARKGKTKPMNPGGKIASGSIVKKGNSYEYKTVGGGHYTETTDPSTSTISTHTTGLLYDPSLGRSDTKRPKGQYQTYSHYPLSAGQVTNNQMPQSHWAPSSGGMPSGGEARNGWLASVPHNQAVSRFENPMIKKGSLSRPFAYKSRTELRSVEDMAKDKALHKRVAADPRMQGHWKKPSRIQSRYNSIAQATPGQQFIKSESREIIPHTAKTVSMPPTEDLLAGLPYRAFKAEGAQEYGKARKALNLNESSDEDDSELEEATTKKEQSDYMKSKKRKRG